MLIRSFGGAAARLVFAAFAIFAFSAAAQAQFLTFVSATGVDTRPCTVQAQPCKTLQRAIQATSANGEVRLLSRLIGGAVVSKSITIDGADNTIIGTITVNSASAVVTLRKLNLNGRGAITYGIRITSAAAVHIEDCTMERYTDGINLTATTGTKLFVSDTVARANRGDGLYVDAVNAQVVIENSGFDQNGSSGVYLKVAKASVTGSSASGNPQHGFILTSSKAKLTETTADNNGGHGFFVRAGQTFLKSAQASGNGTAGLFIDAVVTGTTNQFAIMNDCVFLGVSGGPGGPGLRNEGSLITNDNNVVVGYIGNAAQTLLME